MTSDVVLREREARHRRDELCAHSLSPAHHSPGRMHKKGNADRFWGASPGGGRWEARSSLKTLGILNHVSVLLITLEA